MSLSNAAHESRAVSILAVQKPALREASLHAPRHAQREAPRAEPKPISSQDQADLKGDLAVALGTQIEHPKVIGRNLGLGDCRRNAHRGTWLEDPIYDLVKSGDPAIASVQQHVDFDRDRVVRHKPGKKLRNYYDDVFIRRLAHVFGHRQGLQQDMPIPVIDAIQECRSSSNATRAPHRDIRRPLIRASCEAAKHAARVPVGSADVHDSGLALDNDWMQEGMPRGPIEVERSITARAASTDKDRHPGKMDPGWPQDPIAFRTSHLDLVKIPQLLKIHAA